MTLAVAKLFSKLLKPLIRPDLYDIWVNRRTWINNMHKCISNRGWLMHEGSGYLFIFSFFFFFLPPWRCFSHILCARACACNPSLTTAGNETKPSSRFVTLSLLGARCGLARGQLFAFTLISEIWKNLYETTLLFGWSDQYVLNHGKSRDISLIQPLPFFWCCRIKSVYAVHVFQLYTARWAL